MYQAQAPHDAHTSAASRHTNTNNAERPYSRMVPATRPSTPATIHTTDAIG
jgi:hypothetical protein